MARCKCDPTKEFCDICLDNMLNDLVDRGMIKKVLDKKTGEWLYQNE